MRRPRLEPIGALMIVICATCCSGCIEHQFVNAGASQESVVEPEFRVTWVTILRKPGDAITTPERSGRDVLKDSILNSKPSSWYLKVWVSNGEGFDHYFQTDHIKGLAVGDGLTFKMPYAIRLADIREVQLWAEYRNHILLDRVKKGEMNCDHVSPASRRSADGEDIRFSFH